MTEECFVIVAIVDRYINFRLFPKDVAILEKTSKKLAHRDNFLILMGARTSPLTKQPRDSNEGQSRSIFFGCSDRREDYCSFLVGFS